MKYVKTRDQLFEADNVRIIQMHVRDTVPNAINPEEHSDVENMSRVRLEVRAKWAKKILPKFLVALNDTVDSLPTGVKLDVYQMTREKHVDYTNDQIVRVMGQVLFLEGRLAYIGDSYFADQINDLDLGTYAHINISTEPPREWIPDVPGWVIGLNRQGKYNLNYEKQIVAKNHYSNQYAGIYRFTCNAPHNIPAIDVLAETAAELYVNRDIDPSVFTASGHGTFRSKYADTQLKKLTYEEVFTNRTYKNVLNESCNKVFCRDLDDKLTQILIDEFKDGEYFKDAFSNGHVKVTDINN